MIGTGKKFCRHDIAIIWKNVKSQFSLYSSLLYPLPFSVCREHPFKNKYLFYRFRDDDMGIGSQPGNAEKKEAEDEFQDTLVILAQIGPDAMMRMILRKP